MGLPKTGTTALFFKIRNSIPREFLSRGLKSYFEPLDYDLSKERADDCILAKVILGPPKRLFIFSKNQFRRKVYYEQFMHFDTKILLVRDPRDRVISHLLYTLGSPFNIPEQRKILSFIESLKEKERNPQSVPLIHLIDKFLKLQDPSADLSKWSERSQSYLNFNMEFHDRYPEMLVMKYEDVIDNQLEPIEKNIGFFLNGNSLVDAQYENVMRTKSYGDWRNWFLPEDLCVEMHKLFIVNFSAELIF